MIRNLKKIFIFSFLSLSIFFGCKKNRNFVEFNEDSTREDITTYWSQTNLGNFSVVSLAINQGGDIFAGTAGDLSTIKIYRSKDDGENWELLNTPTIQGDIEIISICNNGYIYAAYDNGMNGGIIYSTDNGESWNRTNTPGMSITSIVFNSLDHVYISSSRHDESAGRVLYSTDQGKNWQNTQWSYLESASSLAITSNDHLLVYSVNGLNKSTDNGETWHVIYHDSLLGGYDLQLKSDSLFFLSTVYKGVFRSVDAGLTWSATSFNDLRYAPIFITPEGLILTADCYRIDTAKGIFYSSDEGENWTNITYELVHEPIHVIYTSPNGYIFIGTFHYGVMKMDITRLNYDQ